MWTNEGLKWGPWNRETTQRHHSVSTFILMFDSGHLGGSLSRTDLTRIPGSCVVEYRLSNNVRPGDSPRTVRGHVT